MKYRRLGGTDLDVSVICLGPMRAAAREPGDDSVSKAGEAALRRALDIGVNFIHSSYEYGTWWMLSRVLRDHPRRDALHHVIKLPVPDTLDNGRFDPVKFRTRIADALTALHTERVDVLQWMWRSDPNEDALRLPMLRDVIDEVSETFERVREEGKAGYLMTFPYTFDCARAAVETGRFSGLIAYYNLAEMEMADLFKELDRRNMGFLCIRPLYQGILTDERAPDRMRADDRFIDAAFEKDLARRAAIAAAFADDIGDSMTGFALRCALAAPVVASVIVGLNTPEQVDGLAGAVEAAMPGADVLERARDLWRADYRPS